MSQQYCWQNFLSQDRNLSSYRVWSQETECEQYFSTFAGMVSHAKMETRDLTSYGRRGFECEPCIVVSGGWHFEMSAIKSAGGVCAVLRKVEHEVCRLSVHLSGVGGFDSKQC